MHVPFLTVRSCLLKQASTLLQVKAFKKIHAKQIQDSVTKPLCLVQNTSLLYRRLINVNIVLSSSRYSNFVKQYGAERLLIRKPSVIQELAEYFREDTQVFDDVSLLSPVNSTVLEKDISLIPQLFVTIAANPDVDHRNVLKLFSLYSNTMRPLMQDKIDYPESYSKLATVTEQAMKMMEYRELKELGQYLNVLQCQKLNIISRLMISLCQECSARLDNVSLCHGIQFFEICLEMYGPAVQGKSFYPIFQEYFLNKVNEASEKDLVKIMYYCSFHQKTAEKEIVKKALETIENCFQSTSFVSFGIIAFSVAKCGMDLNPHLTLLPMIVPIIEERIKSTVPYSDLELFSMASIIELFRLSRYYNMSVISSLETFLMNCDESCLDTQTIPCFLAYLANAKTYNRTLFNHMEQRLLHTLTSDSGPSIKLSELSRVLWAFSSTNHKCSRKFVQAVFNDLQSHVVLGNANKNLLKFTDSLLSLAMMGHGDAKLFKEAFMPPRGRAKDYTGSLQQKLNSRLVSLRYSLAVEAPELCLPSSPLSPAVLTTSSLLPSPAASTSSLLPPSLTGALSSIPRREAHLLTYLTKEEQEEVFKKRPGLQMLLTELQPLNSLFSENDPVVSVIRPIPTASIASIYLKRTAFVHLEHSFAEMEKTEKQLINWDLLDSLKHAREDVCIEVIDDTCTIKDSEHGRRWTGLMAFKLRLMEKIGWNYIFIDSKIAENSDDIAGLVINTFNSRETYNT